ncbi:MAG TPA: TadE family type IV pilus minor pilin [Actinomycetales bacterium]|nr:TadE family type IV pilus minor pilin [Actinomycetales bacterium]
MRDTGSVTAEVAVAMTGVVLLLGGVLGAAAVAATHVRVGDAAGAGARAAARGDAPAAVLATTRRVAGPGAEADVTRSGDLLTVRASAPVRVPLVGTPVLVVRASASALVEVPP